MEIIIPGLKVLGVLGFIIFVYFFTVTRLAVAVKSFQQKPGNQTDNLYWLYTNKYLIKLTDNQFVVTAVLLFQYNNLVGKALQKLECLNPKGEVLQISCAYGNFSERLAQKCAAVDASKLVVCDIVGNQLDNVEPKLRNFSDRTLLLKEDANKLSFADNSFDSVLMFFLLHELPYAEKKKTLDEAMRVIRPGGQVILAEFHKPSAWPMKIFGLIYFFLFEPFALDMWGRFSLEDHFENQPGGPWTLEKEACFFNNFQLITATKQA